MALSLVRIKGFLTVLSLICKAGEPFILCSFYLQCLQGYKIVGRWKDQPADLKTISLPWVLFCFYSKNTFKIFYQVVVVQWSLLLIMISIFEGIISFQSLWHLQNKLTVLMLSLLKTSKCQRKDFLNNPGIFLWLHLACLVCLFV